VPGDNNESMKVFGFSAESVQDVWLPDVGRQTISETAAINDIAFCNPQKCADDCGEAQNICDSGFVVTDAPSGSPTAEADVWNTTNEGVTWTNVTPGEITSPFGNGEDIASGVCFEVDKDTTRYLVARGTADASNPMEIAYRDGTTGAWTRVNVGSTNNQVAQGPQALFAIDFYHIWLVTSGGYIYFSDDGGVTWVAQEEGVLTTQNLFGIHGSGTKNLYVVGASDVVLISNDGGQSWSTATATGGGNTNQRVFVLSKNVAWVGDNGGQIFRTADGGTTWTEFTNWTGTGTGEIKGIGFASDLVGFMLHNDATPTGYVFYTINGGATWRRLSTDANNGLNSLYVCSAILAYAVGEAGDDGTGVILKVAVA